MDQVGYRLYAVSRDALQGRDVGTQSGGHVVVGRHSCCDLVIGPSDGGVSLRHLLVRAFTLDDGLPVVSVLDLDSRSGFELHDGSKQRAVVASGPLVFRIGSTWLVALPSGEPLPDTLEPPLVKQVDDGSYRVNPRADHLGTSRVDEWASSAQVQKSSRITLVPWSVSLANRATGRRDDGSPFEMTLANRDRRATVRFAERDVEHGILVGRADKCVDAGLRGVLSQSPGISRVHALVIRERNGIRLYDVASMNGTSDGVHRIRSVMLAEHVGQHTTVYFKGGIGTTMRWRVLR